MVLVLVTAVALLAIVGFIVRVRSRRSHDTVSQALLARLRATGH